MTMKQLIQDYKTGEMSVLDVPVPGISKGFVLVENRFSLISAGTERSTVRVAKASLIGKARQRPDLVGQVIGNIKKEGVVATLEKVRTKLDSYSALGYSSAGVVCASLDTNSRFQPGQRVACAGQNYASHAEIVSVPQNLIARIPDNVSFRQAAFTTLGSIAIQGVRQAEPTLGEYVCVIGLGLLGQITCQLLRANGCQVFGIDLVQDMVDLANKTGCATAVNRSSETLEQQMAAFTHGRGFDKAIITAAAPSNDPLVLATEILRKRGRIVLVGAVPIKIPRDPHFYRNELDLRISCSYGPGRYDPSYEEEGRDYPIGYVRWTEQRNMEAFLDLLSSGSVDLAPLITHIFEINDALDAYALVEGRKKEPYVGILFRYEESGAGLEARESRKPYEVVDSQGNNPQKLTIGFIGAGSFAQGYLLPYVTSFGRLKTAVTATGVSATNVKKKFGFSISSCDASDVLRDRKINTVFVATRHDTHAGFVLECLKAGKAVFVEKPLCLTLEELEEIRTAYYGAESPFLMVGYNRRFSPIAVAARDKFHEIAVPMLVQYRINAGHVPRDHWTQRKDGGGRILGEVCHFVDLIHFLTGSRTERVHATALKLDNNELTAGDNVAITLELANGSVGQILYCANGDKSLPKERVEVFGGGRSFVIDDYSRGYYHENNRMKLLKMRGKGHREEVELFCNAIAAGEKSPIDFEELCDVSRVTLAVCDCLATGRSQRIRRG
jgi:polar amino acid transport system substrate-binding protein